MCSPVPRLPDPAAPSADENAAALERAIGALGVRGSIRAEGRVATLTLAAAGDDDTPLLSAAQRTQLLGAAKALGFTHVALSIADAPVRGDQPAG